MKMDDFGGTYLLGNLHSTNYHELSRCLQCLLAERTGRKELVAHDVFASWRPSTVRIGVVSDNLAAGQRTLNQTVCAH